MCDKDKFTEDYNYISNSPSAIKDDFLNRKRIVSYIFKLIDDRYNKDKDLPNYLQDKLTKKNADNLKQYIKTLNYVYECQHFERDLTGALQYLYSININEDLYKYQSDLWSLSNEEIEQLKAENKKQTDSSIKKIKSQIIQEHIKERKRSLSLCRNKILENSCLDRQKKILDEIIKIDENIWISLSKISCNTNKIKHSKDVYLFSEGHDKRIFGNYEDLHETINEFWEQAIKKESEN